MTTNEELLRQLDELREGVANQNAAAELVAKRLFTSDAVAAHAALREAHHYLKMAADWLRAPVRSDSEIMGEAAARCGVALNRKD